MISDDLLDKWEKICDQATKEPWEAGSNTVGGPFFTEGIWEWSGSTNNAKDAKFIKTARTALPLLINEIRIIRKVVKTIPHMGHVSEDGIILYDPSCPACKASCTLF